ncbi:unnamed protein product, partial [Mesorhabditis spiculigera]
MSAPLAGVGGGRIWKMPTQTKTLVAVGVGISVILLSWWIKRLFSKPKKPPQRRQLSLRTPEVPSVTDFSNLSDSDRTYRTAPSRQSMRRRLGPSISGSVPPNEAVLFGGLDNCRETISSLQKAMNGLEMIKNRSERDRQRAESLAAVLDRLRFVEADLNRVIQEGGFDHLKAEDGVSLGSGFQLAPSMRTKTLSVLSDESFMSAVEDFAVSLDEDPSAPNYEIASDELLFLQQGYEAARNGQVACRRDRSDICQCANEEEFLAKLFCIRKALNIVCADEHRRVWLQNSGRTLLGNLMQNCQQDPTTFFKAYDDMMNFFEDEINREMAEDELRMRGVPELGFWDVILDFILLDAFGDLKSPPSAIYSVTKNFWLSQSMKYSTISTVIWSMLKAKRQRLQYPNGFIAHFYNISEAVSPSITLGFLGTDAQIGELCYYFKEQVTQLVLDLFNPKRVRYTTVEEMADDAWVIIQNRTESILSRLSSELLM